MIRCADIGLVAPVMFADDEEGYEKEAPADADETGLDVTVMARPALLQFVAVSLPELGLVPSLCF